MEPYRPTYPTASLTALQRAINEANDHPSIRGIGRFAIESAHSIDTTAKQVIFWRKGGSGGKAFFWFAKGTGAYDYHQAIARINGAVLFAEATAVY